jgi:hypothetical protein
MRYRTILAATGVAALLITAGCDIEKTQEGELPDVDVSVKGGQLPKYDVDAPDVDVGTKNVEVTVPDIDVDMPDQGDADDVEGR